MELVKKLDEKNIQDVLKKNFVKLMPAFYEMQSSFLSGVYKRYGDLEGGHIVIFFARNLHLKVLRKREIDLNFDLSLDRFWHNHKGVLQEKQRVVSVSNFTGLPKETARRKIIYLIKSKHIKKNEKNKLYWEPASDLKETYISIIEEQIKSLSRFIFEQTKFLNMNLSFVKIEKEIKNNYSFHWFHYLDFQLQYMKFWQKNIRDLESLLIILQPFIRTFTFLKSNNPILPSLDSVFLKKISSNELIKSANVSATSISEITGIPRATCIRKLESFVRQKVLAKDPQTKRYYLTLDKLSDFPDLYSENNMKNTINIFSRFSSILLRTMTK